MACPPAHPWHSLWPSLMVICPRFHFAGSPTAAEPHFGVMHAKLMLLLMDDRLRIVISSANFMPFHYDWVHLDFEDRQETPTNHFLFLFFFHGSAAHISADFIAMIDISLSGSAIKISNVLLSCCLKQNPAPTPSHKYFGFVICQLQRSHDDSAIGVCSECFCCCLKISSQFNFS